jgi:hypothetical protein
VARADLVQLGERELHRLDPTLAPVILRAVIVVLLVAALGLGLGFAAAPHLGWASPFSLPTHVSFRGTYYEPDPPTQVGCSKSRGAHRVGSVFGYFTTSKPILLTHYEWAHQTKATWILVGVRPGCFKVYADTGNMG